MPFAVSDRTRDLLVQSFLIVLSVLLALFLDELRGDYKRGLDRDQAVGNVVGELRDNADAMERATETYREVSGQIGAYLDSLDAVGGSVPRPALQILPGLIRGGLEPPATQRTAWEAAQLSSGYGLIPYEATYRLARLYDLQESGVVTSWNGVTEKLLSREGHDADEAESMLRALQYGFRELADQGDFLLGQTRETAAEVCASVPVASCASGG